MNHDNRHLHSLISGVRTAALAADLPWRRIAESLSAAVLGALLSAATLFGTAHPFALAWIASAEGGVTALSAWAGALFGMVAQNGASGACVGATLLVAARLTVGVWLSGTAGKAGAPENSASSASKGGIIRRAAAAIAARGARESIWLRAAFATAAAMAAGAISVFADGASFSAAAVFLTAAAAPIATLAFCTRTLRQLSRTQSRDAGSAMLLFAVVRALRDATGLLFAVDVVAAFAASMLAARGWPGSKQAPMGDAGRIMRGVCAGLCVGFAVDPGGAPLYAAAALAAGILFPRSPAAAVCAGWAAAMGIAFADGGLVRFAAVMPEMTVTAALFIPLMQFRLIPAPEKARPVGESVSAAVLEAENAGAKADFGIRRMRSLASSLRAVSEVIATLSKKFSRPPLSEAKRLSGEAFARSCTVCENRALCRERECAVLDDTICRLSLALYREGRVNAGLIPPALASRCHWMDAILTELEERWALACRRALEGDHSEIFALDYSALASLLEDAAAESEESYAPDEAATARLRREMAAMDLYAGSVTVAGTRRRRITAQDLDLTRLRMGNGEIRASFERMLGGPLSDPEYRIDGERVSMRMESMPRFSVAEGSATRAAAESADKRREKKSPNGDCAAHFETEDGRYYMLICDGMGTGAEAAVTARLSAAFLTEVLSGGAQMNAALTMLNSYLGRRNMECSAGIDLMEIDRYTGEARFVKSGAAPSFVLRRGRLFRLASKTAPIGILRALDAEMIRFPLETGDTIVMISDGVSENFEDAPWLCDMLASEAVMAASPDEIAEKIVRAASLGDSQKDDISAAVVRVA